MGFWLAYLHLMLTNTKSRDQAYFDSEYLENGDTQVKITITIK